MSKYRNRYIRLIIVGGVLALLLGVSAACGAEATPTQVAPAPAAPALAPTAAPQPTATLIPGAPTPIAVQPTSTRVLPTPTPVVTTGKPTYGGVLRIAYATGATTLDPQLDNATYGRPMTYALFNTLVAYDPQFNIVPEIAQSWEFSTDGKTVTFRLVPGIKFQDGTPVDAEAVKWSLERVMNPDSGIPGGDLLQPFITKIEVADSTTLVIRLLDPFRPLLANLGERPGFVVPKSKAPVKAEGKLSTLTTSGFSGNPVGSGPFKLKEWRPGSYVRLERWDSYWEKGKPYLDGILFQEVGEESSRFAMLRTGETDMIEMRAQNLPLIRSNPNIKVVPHESGTWEGMHLAVEVPPWNNKALRQAFAFSIDRQSVVDKYFGGAGRPAYISEGTGWAYNPDIKPITSDPKKAKEKLAEAGYPNGLTLTFYCTSDSQDIQICEMYQSMAGAVGLKLDMRIIPKSDVGRLMIARQITNYTPGSLRPRADPDGRLRPRFHSKGGNNFAAYNVPEVDKLLDDAVKVYDIAKAKVLYDRVQTIISDDAPSIFVAYPTYYAGLNAKIQNFSWIPDIQWRVRDLWLEK